MDDLLSKLLEFPPHPPPQIPLSDQAYDDGIRRQIAFVRKVSEKNLLSSTSGGESLLDVINPAINSAPYLVVLIAHIRALDKNLKGANLDTIWEKISGFLESFDGRQIRYLGDEYYSLLVSVEKICFQSGQASLAVIPLRNAVLRLDPSGSILTTAHIQLVRIARATRAYNEAVPVIEKFILYVPKKEPQPKPKYICDLSLSPAAYISPNSGHTAKVAYQEVLEYFYYSGGIFTGLRRWADAVDCFENCITYPAKDGACSKIMTDAYKQWVIVSVLAEGRLRSLPKTTSPGAVKAFRVIGKAYETVASIFETGTAVRLKAEIEYGVKTWHDDYNVGIMNEILSAYQKFQVRNLGQVYTKISIPEIHNQTVDAVTGSKLPTTQAVENLVQTMIQDGSLNGTMSTINGVAVLTFTAGGPVLTEAEMHRELLASTQRIHALTQDIKQTDRALTHEKDYISYSKKMKGKGNKFEEQDPGFTDWNTVEEEEDLMTPMH